MSLKFGRFALLAALVWNGSQSACGPAGPKAAEESARPGINAEYTTTPLEMWVERFESESREIYRQRDQIMKAAGVSQGMAVADVGAGTGFFTEMFAREVGPAGKVFAVDITPAFIERIQADAKKNGLSNVTTVLCTDKDVMLPPGSIDLAFVCDTYHHFEYPAQTLASIRRALKAGGKLVIVDFIRVPEKSRPWVLEHVRIGKDDVIREVRAAGFKLLDEPPTPFLAENYILRFVK